MQIFIRNKNKPTGRSCRIFSSFHSRLFLSVSLSINIVRKFACFSTSSHANFVSWMAYSGRRGKTTSRHRQRTNNNNNNNTNHHNKPLVGGFEVPKILCLRLENRNIHMYYVQLMVCSTIISTKELSCLPYDGGENTVVLSPRRESQLFVDHWRLFHFLLHVPFVVNQRDQPERETVSASDDKVEC